MFENTVPVAKIAIARCKGDGFFFFQMKLGSFEEYQMICQLSYFAMLVILTIAFLKLHRSSTQSGLHDSLCSTYVVYGKIINKVFKG